MDYKIKLAAFEGPLNLLMHLIEKNKIDIYEIPMADLTQQYMDYINEAQEFNVEVAAEFLVMAAKLIQIKSRILLPVAGTSEKSQEDDEIITDPREELVQRLLQYQRFQKAGEMLSSMLTEEEKFIKRPPLKLPKKKLPLQNLSLDKLFKSLLSALSAEEDLMIPQALVTAEIFHIKDKMSAILSKLENDDEIKLSEIIETKSISEFVATFLALLELIKRHKVTAEQILPFTDILISNADTNIIDTPHS